MIKRAFKISTLFVVVSLLFAAVGCGGSSGGGGISSETAVRIEGNLSVAAINARTLRDGAIAGVTVSALGDSAVTNDLGDFVLEADGTTFGGGAVQFMVSGPGIEGTAVFDDVAGGPGALAFIELYLENDGRISGVSIDETGTVISRIFGGGALGCTQEGTFVDGGEGALWKPVSESTGTVVVLMPPSYNESRVQVFNANGNEVASIIRTRCCDTNGNRAHWWWNRSASSLAGEALPLTVRFEFPSGTVDCRSVPNPRQRYD